jgi:hypothetical protein
LVFFEYQKFWFYNIKAIAKDKKSISQLPISGTGKGNKKKVGKAEKEVKNEAMTSRDNHDYTAKKRNEK